MEDRIELKGLYPDELEELAVSLGLEPYRGRQIAAWMYNYGITDFEQMTNLSRAVRQRLAQRASILDLKVAGESGGGDTIKYLFELPDKKRVESVLMRDGRRRTLCISSQVGCPLDCSFCATGRMGLLRDLTAGEILDQLLFVRRTLVAQGDDLTNVVMMGMGEPLLNYDNVVRAIRLMNLDYGPAMGIRRITLSTVGHVPGILRLADEKMKIGLAISLNASTDEQRSQIMPINRKWPIAELLDAVRAYQKKNGRRVTFEYVMLHGFNDSPEDAHRLVKLTEGISRKINVIPWNPIDGMPFVRPPQEVVDRFVQILADAHITATVRYSKGVDIAAGCGQLFQEAAAMTA
ncbi:MAG: 23S rRNA (adenine(2503)-C(2))-methyltransferase RlmN [bacterium]|nr:23S rRNA (adenine(2503)-C(2))-methyltransferase RlmN [bacterium]